MNQGEEWLSQELILLEYTVINCNIPLLAKYHQSIWRKRINSPLAGWEVVTCIRAGSGRMNRQIAGKGGHLRQRNWHESLFMPRSPKAH